jgi:hypothetical protein
VTFFPPEFSKRLRNGLVGQIEGEKSVDLFAIGYLLSFSTLAHPKIQGANKDASKDPSSGLPRRRVQWTNPTFPVLTPFPFGTARTNRE